MLKKFSLIPRGLLFGLVLSACAVKSPNVPVCFELSMERGYCIKTISNEEFEVNETKKLEGKTWFEARTSMLLLPASSWVEIKAFIIKICEKTKQCDMQSPEWKNTVNTIDDKIYRN